MPETAAYSAVIAIHTLWLAARAHGLGLGWVSILDPAALTAALDVPAILDLHRLSLPRLPQRGAGDARTRTRRLGTPAPRSEPPLIRR